MAAHHDAPEFDGTPSVSVAPPRAIKFFVVGDPGQAGGERSAVGRALAALQHQWREQGEVLASFAISTGDNVYGPHTDAAFEKLSADLLNPLPLPWIIALGNHDIIRTAFAWNHERHGMTGSSDAAGAGAKWQWICPAPAFIADSYLTPAGCPPDLLSIFVINSNAFWRSSPVPAPGFYESLGESWWKEQNSALVTHLEASTARWKIVVGHHPVEILTVGEAPAAAPTSRFVPDDHLSPLRRSELFQAIAARADLYIAGHQHLSAVLQVDRGAAGLPAADCRCAYAITGASSSLDQPQKRLSLGQIRMLQALPPAALRAPPPDAIALLSPVLAPSERYQERFAVTGLHSFQVVEVHPTQLSIATFIVPLNRSSPVEVHRLVIPYSAAKH
jgi:hypothetical protein